MIFNLNRTRGGFFLISRPILCERRRSESSSSRKKTALFSFLVILLLHHSCTRLIPRAFSDRDGSAHLSSAKLRHDRRAQIPFALRLSTFTRNKYTLRVSVSNSTRCTSQHQEILCAARKEIKERTTYQKERKEEKFRASSPRSLNLSLSLSVCVCVSVSRPSQPPPPRRFLRGRSRVCVDKYHATSRE